MNRLLAITTSGVVASTLLLGTSASSMASTSPHSLDAMIEHMDGNTRATFLLLPQRDQDKITTYLMSEQGESDAKAASERLQAALMTTPGNAPVSVTVGHTTFVATPFVEDLSPSASERSAYAGDSKRRAGWDFKSIAHSFVFGQFKQVMQFWYRGATIKHIDSCTASISGVSGDVSDNTNFDRSRVDIKEAWCSTTWKGKLGIGPVNVNWSHVQGMTVNSRGITAKTWDGKGA